MGCLKRCPFSNNSFYRQDVHKSFIYDMIGLMCALFDTEPRKDLEHNNKIQEVTTPDKVKQNDSKYEAEIKALVAEFGSLSGLCIEIDLQRLLEIVPRRRRRTDAYQGLVSELKSKLDCELIIRSRKNKSNENE